MAEVNDTVESWSQFDLTDTLFSFPVTLGDSGLAYKGQKKWDVINGMSQHSRDFSCSALFSIDSVTSMGALSVTISDYRHAHSRIDIIIDRSLFSLVMDSLALVSNNADSVIFQGVVNDPSAVQFWREKEYGFSWIIAGARYLTSRSPTIVRAVIKR